MNKYYLDNIYSQIFVTNPSTYDVSPVFITPMVNKNILNL